ncbi:hypothetical protein JAAARDRAFT_273895 [Jaapia argillacea MUCL 33604]|uniref:Uncharacterized protein n=1 Tax=Jaapia argillacea MUCL 33604 TaxID=933084 RepID=A0A067PSM9_9AGAM|nr:hypothetical protein JAAARDRAFT_273895 [Jaapia argillacea MUCL 33604]
MDDLLRAPLFLTSLSRMSRISPTLTTTTGHHHPRPPAARGPLVLHYITSPCIPSSTSTSSTSKPVQYIKGRPCTIIYHLHLSLCICLHKYLHTPHHSLFCPKTNFHAPHVARSCYHCLSPSHHPLPSLLSFRTPIHLALLPRRVLPSSIVLDTQNTLALSFCLERVRYIHLVLL